MPGRRSSLKEVQGLRTKDEIDSVTQDSWDIYKQPITISYQVVLSFEMQPTPANRHPGKQALFVNMDPIITLWNPLDVPVHVAPHKDPQGRTKCWMYVFWVIPYDINVQVSFIIRAYGEARDKAGNVMARAWCEAFVERERSYVDPADKVEILPANLTSAANRDFGRRFNMISFRWLNANEV